MSPVSVHMRSAEVSPNRPLGLMTKAIATKRNTKPVVNPLIRGEPGAESHFHEPQREAAYDGSPQIAEAADDVGDEGVDTEEHAHVRVDRAAASEDEHRCEASEKPEMATLVTTMAFAFTPIDRTASKSSEAARMALPIRSS